MDVSREDELDLGDPLLDCLRLGLRSLVILFEVVGEVTVQVEAARVVSAEVMVVNYDPSSRVLICHIL